MQEITIPLQNYQEHTFHGELVTSREVHLWGLNRTGTVELYKLEPEAHPALRPSAKYLIAIESMPKAYEIKRFYNGESLREYFENLTLDQDHPLRRSGIAVFFAASEAEPELKPLYSQYRNSIGINGVTTGEIEKAVRKQTEKEKAGWGLYENTHRN